MIITDRFVYIHMPKTGGTFVTAILKQLFKSNGKPSLQNRIYQKIIGKGKFTSTNKHGFCFQIPPEYAQLPVVGCIRNPYDRYVSQYTFNWWKTHPDDFPGLKEHPKYPDLSFADFIHLANEKWRKAGGLNLELDPALGWHTSAFVTWYCENPAELLSYDRANPLTAERIRKSLRPETLLRTHRLNQDLHEYLLRHGFSEPQLSFILTSPKIMPREGGRSEHQKWEKYYTPELKAYVREREQLLFALFPEFDV